MRSKNGFKDKKLVFKLFEVVERGVDYKEFVNVTGHSAATYYRIKNAIIGQGKCPYYYKILYEEYKEKKKNGQRLASEINRVLKFCYNRIDYKSFTEIFQLTYNNVAFAKAYFDEKWRMFNTNMVAFLISYPEFLQTVIEKIDEENYQG